mmetsp:Transcript_74999/g.173938  ORF Transcript_74999/g.173938 Transcript_74999/m.173938 type:complete len:159 (+) Transcript_74999:65-541(+)
MRAGPWRNCAKVAWFGVPPLMFVKDRWVWLHCVEGHGMDPTLNPQAFFVDRYFQDWVLIHRNAEFQKGDIVVLRDPDTNNRVVRRLMAREREVLRNGDGAHIYVPAGHCWVEGDNARLSADSRSWGVVPMGLLDALVVAVVWPFWRARVFEASSAGPQ